MSWMSQLYQTYEQNEKIAATEEVSLTPIAHMYANAQIEVTVDNDGRFVSASKMEKGKAVTLIPVTEASAGRASGIAPHALSDTLSYIAGDFSSYCSEEKQRKLSKEKYASYSKNLENWTNSEFCHPKVKAIYQYLSQKILISDLMKAGIIKLDKAGYFENEKIAGQPYEKALVRFRVIGEKAAVTDKTWEDQSLIDAYIRFYGQSQNGRKDICYLTGKETVISTNHPKGIVASNYGAKLISANDDQGYTFRGRFQNAEQAYALGYEASQKIHSALTWLVKKQGVYVGTADKRTFVCWNPEGKKTPDILDCLGLEEEEPIQDGGKYKKKLTKIFQGYQDQFTPDEQIMVMGLDAATTGRLSITYYNEFYASDFFERISYWGETCNWYTLRFTNQKIPYYTIQTPTFRQMVECAFGNEKGNFIEANDKLLKEQVQRLLKCMLEKQSLPGDIMTALVSRASTPLAYSRGNRERVWSVACAAIMKYHYDREKGERDIMNLDLENHDRSYLFGRLLAVYEQVERRTYDREEGREPNAIRLQSAYVNHPMQTRMILEDAVRPYFAKLKPAEREKYRGLIEKITLGFQDMSQKQLNQRLGEMYLIGYYLQRAEFKKKREKQEDESNEQLTEQD